MTNKHTVNLLYVCLCKILLVTILFSCIMCSSNSIKVVLVLNLIIILQLAVPEDRVLSFGMTLPGPGVTEGQVCLLRVYYYAS